MSTLYEKLTDGLDPKMCYFVSNLEPATYRCTCTETLNITQMSYTEYQVNLTLYKTYVNKLKAFVWTRQKEGTYCVGKCKHNMNLHSCSCTISHCFNLTNGENAQNCTQRWSSKPEICIYKAAALPIMSL